MSLDSDMTTMICKFCFHLDFLAYFHYFICMPAEVFEEVLEIVSYMTFFSPAISLDMWSLWPLMMEALADWAIDFFPSMVLNYILTLFLLCSWPSAQLR